VSTVSSCCVQCIVSSSSRFPMGDSPPLTAQHTRRDYHTMPRFLLLNPSNPVRQRLSRWGRCLTTGFPLLCHPSLTGGVVRRQVKPRPVYSLRQPMQALYYRGRYGHRKRKTLKAWFSVCQARSHLRGKNQSLRA
jgi:hypothetical protein